MSEDLAFGECLGTFHGVPAFSNINDGFFSGEKHYLHGIYTGYKYQCVEYARRYLLQVKACQFKGCFRAAEIFDMDEVTNIETAEVRPFLRFENGKTATKPTPGHILVYPWDEVKMPVGHVAVIAAVGDDWVGIAEQNEGSTSWGALPYGRKVALVRDAATGFWTMQETDPDFSPCRGWMAADFADRPDIHQPLTPLPQFLTPREETAFNRRRLVPPTAALAEARASWTYPLLELETDAERAVAAAIEAKSEMSLHHLKSVLYANEDGRVGCIGCCNGGARAINSALPQILAGYLAKTDDSAAVAQWLSTRYGVPLAYAQQVRRSYEASQHGHGTLFAALVIGFSAADKSHKILSANFDTCENLSLSAVFQQRISQSNGHAEGFSSGIKQDVTRFVGKVAPADDSEPLCFLDFGPASKLPAAVFAGDTAAARQYDVERTAKLHLCAIMQAATSEAKVQTVRTSDIAVAASGEVVVAATQRPLRVVQKTCTWATIFRIAASAGLEAAAAKVFGPEPPAGVTVYEPLFAAITATPQFLADVAEVLHTRDESALSEALVEVKEFIPASLERFEEAVFSDPGKYGPVYPKPIQVRCLAFLSSCMWSTFLFAERPMGAALWRPAVNRVLREPKVFSELAVPEDD